MVDFSNVKQVEIPEGIVKSISSNGTVLWESGGLPSAYQQVEWIAGTSNSVGTNFIDTGIKMQQGIEIIFGVSWNNDFSPYYDRLAGFDTLNWIEAGSSGTRITFYQHGSYNGIGTGRTEIKITTTYWAVNGTTIQTYSTPTFSGTNVILLSNAYYGQWTADGRWSIRDCIIKVNDEIVFNAVPCYRKSDNEIGMYDLVSKKFLTNAGYGSSFIKGGNV